MKRILVLTAATFILALTAWAGSTPITQRDVILIESIQDWNAAATGFPATILSCTRSSGAPGCRVGDNTAQVLSDLLTAGFRCDPALGQAVLGFGVVCLR